MIDDYVTRAKLRERVIRDPLYGYVHVPGAIEPIIEHPYVQRLRRVSQTSASSSVYPSMNGRRFEHSLGTMHLAQGLWKACWSSLGRQNSQIAANQTLQAEFVQGLKSELLSSGRRLNGVTKQWVENTASLEQSEFIILDAVAAAGLLHDLGHPPFSHTLEDFYSQAMSELSPQRSSSYISRAKSASRIKSPQLHEQLGLYMLEDFGDEHTCNVAWELVCEILWASDFGSCLYTLKQIISSEVDADRLDYLVRDSRNSGTEFGAIDVERLVESTEIRRVDDRWKLGILSRASTAIESLFTQRHQYYRTVALHPHAVATNRMLKLALVSLRRSRLDMRSIFYSQELPDIRYFVDSVSVKDTEDAAGVDDETIDQILKYAWSWLRHASVAGKVSSIFDKRLETFISTVLFRKPTWQSVWRTDLDYVAISSELVEAIEAQLPDVKSKISELKVQLGADRTIDDERRQRRIRELDSELWYIEHTFGTRADHVVKVNDVIRKLVWAKRRLTWMLDEEDFSSLLTDASDFSTLDGDSTLYFWLAVFEPLEPWSEGENRLAVFHGKSICKASEISEGILTLKEVEQRRPQFRAFLVSAETGNRQKQGKEGVDSSKVKSVFLAAFPNAVKKSWLRRIERIATGIASGH